jgi:hypothetical protein
MRIVVVLAFALSGCAIGTGTREFIGPDGDTVHESKCNGTMRTMADCYQQASETCNGPYEVLDGDESQHGSINTESGTIQRNRYERASYDYESTGTSVAIVKRNLRYRCKDKNDDRRDDSDDDE